MLCSFLVISLLVKASESLRLVRLDVPSVVRRGEPAWLNCSYQLGNDQLYSIKWYKNNVEIYRFLPSEVPPVKVYNMPGIHVDLSKSNESNLYLNTTDLNSEGKYRCEVSAESPSFQTERGQKEMLIYVLPEEDPTIKGLQSQYKVGDVINLTCSYGPSRPNASVTWYINDRKVSGNAEEVIQTSSYIDGEGLMHTTSRMMFRAQFSHFWHGAMEVRCSSHASLPYYVSSEEVNIRENGRKVDVSGPQMNGPQIDGSKNHYRLGSIVDLSCRAEGDAPAHELKWLINDKEAQDSYVSYTPPFGPDGHSSTVLRLHFRLTEQHFSKGELRLKCVSKQVREFTADRSFRIPMSDKGHTSGLQVSFSRANSGTQRMACLTLMLLLLTL
ncbi:uncharacterized protein LOC135385350 [Ornithodoros turicata]|uniref:uncharacterized protein LOC135385350 n=1 Tax=Ornithodoros turicata TaxID=34597 RepID=UPI003138DC34